MSKIAIFASGAGSNAQEIIKFVKPPISVDLLVTNKAESGLIKIGKTNGIDVKCYSNQELNDSGKTIALLKTKKIEWIVLAGYLRKIPKELIDAYPNRIFNIHPSLLPKYGGKGMYGNFVHESVLLNKDKKSGITIHLVNEEYDKGKILIQKECEVLNSDSVLSLAKKVQKLEHEFFPKTIVQHILKAEK